MTQYVRPMDLHAHNDGCELYGCIAVEPVTDRSVNFERAAAYQRELESKLDSLRITHPTDICDCRFDYSDGVQKVRRQCDYHKGIADRLDTIRAGVAPLVRAARSWHDFHHGSTIVQCDAICETLPAAEEALK